MNQKNLENILNQVRVGELSAEQASEAIRKLTFSDLGFANIDTHREIRTGYPEVIFCQGKTPEQIAGIIKLMRNHNTNILGTRASKDAFEEVRKIAPESEYNETAKCIILKKKDITPPPSYISIVTAGTSDMPVAEEAAVTAEIFGNSVKRVFDVGVAGIHRLYAKLDEVKGARVIVVVAGMEGALPSIIGGLVDKPVIAVPTSIGYGANFGGLSALLGMLTSCASGVSVVNIDNGFGAGYMASMINRLQ